MTGTQVAWFWAAGYTGPSPLAIAEKIHTAWNVETLWDETYERAERSFTERFDL